MRMLLANTTSPSQWPGNKPTGLPTLNEQNTCQISEWQVFFLVWHKKLMNSTKKIFVCQFELSVVFFGNSSQKKIQDIYMQIRSDMPWPMATLAIPTKSRQAKFQSNFAIACQSDEPSTFDCMYSITVRSHARWQPWHPVWLSTQAPFWQAAVGLQGADPASLLRAGQEVRANDPGKDQVSPCVASMQQQQQQQQ